MIGHRRMIGLGVCVVATAILLAGSTRAQTTTTVHAVTRELVGIDERQWCVEIAAETLDGGAVLTTSGRSVGTAEVLDVPCGLSNDRIVTSGATAEFVVVVSGLVEGSAGTVTLVGDDAALALTLPVKERPLRALLLSLVGVIVGAALAGVLAAAPKLRVLGELDRLVRRRGLTLDRSALVGWVEGLLNSIEPREAYAVAHNVTQNVEEWRQRDRAVLEQALAPHRATSSEPKIPDGWTRARRVITAAEATASRLGIGKIDVNDFADALGGRQPNAALGFVPVLDRLADLARHRADGTSQGSQAVDAAMDAWPVNWAPGDGPNFSLVDLDALGGINKLAARVAADDRRRAENAGAVAAAEPAAAAPPMPVPSRSNPAGPSFGSARVSSGKRKAFTTVLAVAAIVMFAGVAALFVGGFAGDDTSERPGTSSDVAPNPTDVGPTLPGTDPLPTTAEPTTTIDRQPAPSAAKSRPLLLGLVAVISVGAFVAVRRASKTTRGRSVTERVAALGRQVARARATPALIVAFASTVAAVGVFVATYAGDATYAGTESWVGTGVAGLGVGGAGGLAATVSRFRLSRPRLSRH